MMGEIWPRFVRLKWRTNAARANFLKEKKKGFWSHLSLICGTENRSADHLIPCLYGWLWVSCVGDVNGALLALLRVYARFLCIL